MVSVGVALSFRRESVGVLTASTVVDALQGAGLTVGRTQTSSVRHLAC